MQLEFDMIRDTRDRYSFKEACQAIGCSHVFLRREIRRGKIGPVVRVNARVIWIERAVLDAYQASKVVRIVSQVSQPNPTRTTRRARRLVGSQRGKGLD